MNRFTLVCADMAGTTVSDGGIMERAASQALAEVGLAIDSTAHDSAMRYIRDTMGKSKIEVFRAILPDEDSAATANAAFETAIARLASDGGIRELPEATQTLQSLRDNGIKVALTTGFSPTTQQVIMAALGWQDLFDLAITPGDGVRGRPYPDMVLHALLRLGIADVRQVAVVGDSVNDIYSGLRAGSGLVAGVTTGAHDANALRRAGATHVLDHISRLPELLPVR